MTIDKAARIALDALALGVIWLMIKNTIYTLLHDETSFLGQSRHKKNRKET